MELAETHGDVQKRRSLLTFSVVGGGLLGSATAAEIRELIHSALISYPGIGREEPRILLFEESEEILPLFDPDLGKAAHGRLNKIGVEVFTGTKITAVSPEEVVLMSGKRIPCRTVVGALTARPRVVSAMPFARPDGRLPVDDFLRVQQEKSMFVAGVCADTFQNPAAKRQIKMGRLAAYNAVAAIQGFKLLRWSRPLVYLAALGRYATVGGFLGIRLQGISAWLMSRASCLLTLPGLERNLRILIDWVLDIPFRNDIVVLAPQRTHKLCRAHYEIGDEIVRQGEKGDSAYLLLAGEVEALQKVNGRMEQLRTCRPGECFGEIALLCNVPRTATIRCLTLMALG